MLTIQEQMRINHNKLTQQIAKKFSRNINKKLDHLIIKEIEDIYNSNQDNIKYITELNQISSASAAQWTIIESISYKLIHVEEIYKNKHKDIIITGYINQGLCPTFKITIIPIKSLKYLSDRNLI